MKGKTHTCGKWSGGPRLSRLLALGEGGRRGVGGCGGGGGCGVRRTMAAALPVAPPPGVEGVDDGNGNATTGGPRVWRLRAAAGDGREAVPLKWWPAGAADEGSAPTAAAAGGVAEFVVRGAAAAVGLRAGKSLNFAGVFVEEVAAGVARVPETELRRCGWQACSMCSSCSGAGSALGAALLASALRASACAISASACTR
eukprot:1156788-Pelagomonas_calceolata.AAC.3